MGKDHVAVLAPHVEVAQHIVRDPPNEIRDPVQAPVAHSPQHLPVPLFVVGFQPKP